MVYKFSPILKSKARSFYVRLGEVLFHIMTFIGAASVALIVLYGSGDWVLLSLAIIFMIGLAWTAKQGLPRFWEQIKLLLNLGTVRENERVIYKGLPWKVVSINLYSRLENPALKSSRIRLPLRGLIELNSRPYHADEPWFPCRKEDWVLLTARLLGYPRASERVKRRIGAAVEKLVEGGIVRWNEGKVELGE